MDDQKALARTYAKLFALGYVPFLLNGWVNSYIYDIPVLYWGFELLSWVIIPIVVFTLAIRAGLTWQELGVSTNIFSRKGIVLLAVLTVLLIPVLIVFDRVAQGLAGALFHTRDFFSYRQTIPLTEPLHTGVVLYMVLSAGIVEELYYRGLLYRICRSFRRPRLLFVSVSPVIFSLAHWEGGPDALLQAWLVGVVYGLVFLWLRNLLPLMVAHALDDYQSFI